MQELIEKEKTEIIKLGVTDAALKELETQCTGLTAGTPKEYEHVRAQIAVCRTLRVNVKNRHQELKAGIIKEGKELDSEKNRVIGLLEDIEDPMKAIKKAVDDEKARVDAEKEAAEAKRIEMILERIQGISSLSIGIIDLPSEMISFRIERIKNVDILDGFFAEFAAQAEQAKVSAILAAEEFLGKKLAHEATVAEESEKLEAQAKENARIAKENERMAEQNKRIADDNKRKADEAKAKLEEKQKEIEAENAKVAAHNKRIADEAQEKIFAENKLVTARNKVLSDELAAKQAEIDKADQDKRDAAERVKREKQLEAMKPDIEKLQTFSDVALQGVIDGFPELRDQDGGALDMIATVVIGKIDDIQEFINCELADIRRMDADI